MTRKTFRQVTQRFKRLPNIILLLAMVANLFLGVQSAAAEGEKYPHHRFRQARLCPRRNGHPDRH